MGGKYINKSQAKLYMNLRNNKGLTQEAASAKADISIRSGYTIEAGKHYTFKSQPRIRNYKTRRSPIDQVWESELEPMLSKNPGLQAKTLFIYLQEKYLDEQGNPIYTKSIERTLQRKVSRWQALNGQPKDIMFPQIHIPGQQALSDFTHFKNAEITIDGKPFKHMLYHFRLVYSKWSFIKVIRTGECMQALSEGLQDALFCLGGSPKEHRTDSLSAAFKNLSKKDKDDLTNSYKELCEYYNMEPTRNNKGQKHENGSVESAHGHIKNRIAQELILRGSNNFKSVSEYEAWVQKIVISHNKRNSIDFDTEKLSLQPLPNYRTSDYEIKSAKISNLSTVHIKHMIYSVPSNFTGHTLTFHIYQNIIKAYLGGSFAFAFDRKYLQKNKSKYVIDYKHIVSALIKKPNAFRLCRYRDSIFPDDKYKLIWEYLERIESKNSSPKLMLRILKLAADYDCEKELSTDILKQINSKSSIDIEMLEAKYNSSNPILPNIQSIQHDITKYDSYIN